MKPYYKENRKNAEMMYAFDRAFYEAGDTANARIYAELLTALGLGVVYIEDSLIVTNCGFFEKFERHLHIVRNDENNNTN